MCSLSFLYGFSIISLWFLYGFSIVSLSLLTKAFTLLPSYNRLLPSFQIVALTA